jgi:oxygen-dependent protoporphyrinogen oxidase
MRIIVIGGGITGLSAAHRLVELCSDKNLPLELLLLEGSDRLGGAIATKRRDGFLIEEGPDSFITTKPWAIELCRRIGLDSQIIQTNDENRRTFVLHHNQLIPLPEGFLMMMPTRFIPFLTSSLFSWHGKMRMLLDLVIPRAQQSNDESLASFVRRRLGQEVLERVAQPMISGIYTADPEKLSLRATMPQFLEMEERHGSLIRAMLHEQRAAKQLTKGESGARYSLFVSFTNGMQILVDALAARLPEGSVKLNHSVKSLETNTRGWNVITDQGMALHADGVIITIPSHRAARLVDRFDQPLAADLSRIEYASSAVINLAYRKEDMSHPLDGFGFVVPIIEKRPMIACSFTSVKLAGRAPDGFVLLRCFVGGAMQPEVYEQDDSKLIETSHKELVDLLEIKGQPLFAMVHRYPKSMPQFQVGHLELVTKIDHKVSKYPGLAIAGNAYGGVGIPDCIHSGESAAEAILKTIY